MDVSREFQTDSKTPFSTPKSPVSELDFKSPTENPEEHIEKGGESTAERIKSSLRLQYEAQVRVIRGQIGDLEKVRTNLGLSQRKIAQLLLVDPSAWTRWTKNGEDAPPHVWRALQWYLSLQEKNPALSPATFLFAGARFPNESALKKLESDTKSQEEKVLRLESQLAELRADQVSTHDSLQSSLVTMLDHQVALSKIEGLRRETKKLRGWMLFWMFMTAGLGALSALILSR